MRDGRAMVVVEKPDGSVEFRQAAFRWRFWRIAWFEAPGPLEFAPRSLRLIARLGVYGTMIGALVVALLLRKNPVSLMMESAAISVGIVALVVALVVHRRRPELVFDATHRQLRRQVGRRNDIIAFDTLDSIFLSPSRSTRKVGGVTAASGRFEVYAKRGEERIPLTFVDSRGEAEDLCKRLSRLVSS